jgi:DNA-binding phage protein
MALYRPRRRVPDSELSPETLASVEARRRERESPEYQEQLARDIEAIQNEFPPARADATLAAFLASLRAERERQGLSLTDVSERSGLTRPMLSNLETGKTPNPTYATLRAYAGALGLRLTLGTERSVD